MAIDALAGTGPGEVGSWDSHRHPGGEGDIILARGTLEDKGGWCNKIRLRVTQQKLDKINNNKTYLDGLYLGQTLC